MAKAMKSVMKSGAKASIGSKKLAKTQIAQLIADQTGLKRKQVTQCLEELAAITSESLHKSGKVTIPGICMVKTRNKPATKARTAMMFGKECRIAAMKAKTVVKAFPIAALKNEYK